MQTVNIGTENIFYKGGQKMDIDIVWNEDELEALEELNAIFNL